MTERSIGTRGLWGRLGKPAQRPECAPRERAGIEELEPRRLYAADLDPLSLATASVAELSGTLDAMHAGSMIALAPAAVTASDSSAGSATQAARLELVFVDAGVPDAPQLLRELRAQAESGRQLLVFEIGAQQDGLQQITDTVAQHEGIAAVHVLSHGDPSGLQLGASRLDANTLPNYAAQLSGWSAHLGADADLMLYGCDLAAGTAGQALAADLALLTGADVASSVNPTGSALLGGDWALESAVGAIESAVALTAATQDAWEHLLPTAVGNVVVVTTDADLDDTGLGASYTIAQLLASQGADGKISLREALIAANNTAGADGIHFNISGPAGSYGEYSINLAAALPTITDTVVLDASTQSGTATHPRIVIDGGGLNADGLRLSASADGSTVRGLVIRDFLRNGINIQAGSDNHTLAGNYIGSFNADGSDAGVAKANGGTTLSGILINGANTVVGGTTVADRNVISGNGGRGIRIGTGADGSSVIGNYIGTTADGSAAFGASAGQWGIQVEGSASNITLGGTSAAERNVISGHTKEGIWVSAAAGGTLLIQGNHIGMSADGSAVVANGQNGIVFTASAANTTTVGGLAAGAGNLIAGNALSGISVGGTVNLLVQGNTITGNGASGISVGSTVAPTLYYRNAIYANGGLGIDINNDGVSANDAADADTGPNYANNHPVIASALVAGGLTTVSGTLDGYPQVATATIEFYASASADPSGHGEGQTYLGAVQVTTDAAGHASFSVSFAGVGAGSFVSALVNMESGQIGGSEFSAAVQVRAPSSISNLSGDVLAYTEDQAATLLDQGAAASVVNTNGYSGGHLRVALTAGASAAEDVLGIRHQGLGAGQIGLGGSTLSYGGVAIGSVAGGAAGADLVITFNASASDAAVSALLHNLTYLNTNTAAPSTAARTLSVVLTDAAALSSPSCSVTVNVALANDAPVITSHGGAALAALSMMENGPAVASVAAADADPGSTLTYRVMGGADAALFAIDAGTGALRFVQAPDFENAADSGRNNVYDVMIEVSDGAAVDTQVFAVTVLDASDAPPPPPAIVIPPLPIPGPITTGPITTGPTPGSSTPGGAESTPQPNEAPTAAQPASPSGSGAGGGDGLALSGGGLDAYRGAELDRVTHRAHTIQASASEPQPDAATSHGMHEILEGEADTQGSILLGKLKLRSFALSYDFGSADEPDGDAAGESTAAGFLMANLSIGSVGLAVSVSSLLWSSRITAMLLTLMSSAPAWTNLDPMPVINPKRIRPSMRKHDASNHQSILEDAYTTAIFDSQTLQGAKRAS